MTLLMAVISSGCAGEGEDAAPEGTPPTVPEPTAPSKRLPPPELPPPGLPEAEQARLAGYTDELESTFNNARDICRYDGSTKIAKELRVPADSPQAVARAYSAAREARRPPERQLLRLFERPDHRRWRGTGRRQVVDRQPIVKPARRK